MARILYMPDPQASDPTRSLESKYLNALLYGGKCLLYAEVTFDDDPAIALPTIPDNAHTAIVYIEAGAADIDKSRVARYREDGTNPAAAAGMAIGDDGIVEISGRANLEAFKIIGINAGVTHTLRVQYYGQG